MAPRAELAVGLGRSWDCGLGSGSLSRIIIYDTTLRDGTQREGISLSFDDKLQIARKLDELGVDYIEGGWPGSNPKDSEFFARARDLSLGHAKLTAFGSTRRPHSATPDATLEAILAADTRSSASSARAGGCTSPRCSIPLSKRT